MHFALDHCPTRGNINLTVSFYLTSSSYNISILLTLILFWCCQTQFLQMHQLLTVMYNCLISMSPFVRILCDIEIMKYQMKL